MSEQNKDGNKKNIENVIKKGMDIAEDGVEKVKEVAENVKEKVTKKLDVDKDGDVDFDDFKLMANKAKKKGESILKNISSDDN